MINKQTFIIIFFLLLQSFLYSNLLKPYNNQNLSYVHILFEWDQIPNAMEYNLQLSNSSTFQNNILDLNILSTTYVTYDENIQWDNLYYWRLRPIYEDLSFGNWSEILNFRIGISTTNNEEISINLINQDNFNGGLTLMGDLTGINVRSFVYDENGKEIWNKQMQSGILVNHVNSFGQIFGGSFWEFPSRTGLAINYDGDELWSGPFNDYVDIHEVKRIPNGNYMGFVWQYENGPIPIGDWSDLFIGLGYEADGITNEFPWFGQAIVEWDQDANEVWRWDPFEHFTMNDYDAFGGTWWNAYFDDQYDWMHSNGFHFDEEESVIYISSRHLSRITKIDYPSGNIVWMIGPSEEFMYSGDEHICSELTISWQHNIQLLDSGNLLLFDNGNLSGIFGEEDSVSRALEFKVINNSYCEIIWEYILPPELHGPFMGGVQYLDNNNYLINTVGGGGHALEVTPDKELVWDASYNLTDNNEPAGNYRSYRIPSIHPNAYSVIFENYIDGDQGEAIYLENNILKILISNKSGYKQYYTYSLSDSNNLFDTTLAEIILEPYSEMDLLFNIQNFTSNATEIDFNIIPIHHSYDSKNYSFQLFLDQIIGDINFDNTINILDVIQLVNIILDNSNYSAIADINNDGINNVLDVIQLVNIILE